MVHQSVSTLPQAALRGWSWPRDSVPSAGIATSRKVTGESQYAVEFSSVVSSTEIRELEPKSVERGGQWHTPSRYRSVTDRQTAMINILARDSSTAYIFLGALIFFSYQLFFKYLCLFIVHIAREIIGPNA